MGKIRANTSGTVTVSRGDIRVTSTTTLIGRNQDDTANEPQGIAYFLYVEMGVVIYFAGIPGSPFSPPPVSVVDRDWELITTPDSPFLSQVTFDSEAHVTADVPGANVEYSFGLALYQPRLNPEPISRTFEYPGIGSIVRAWTGGGGGRFNITNGEGTVTRIGSRDGSHVYSFSLTNLIEVQERDWFEVYRPVFQEWQEVYRPNEPILEWQEVYRPALEITEWEEVYRPRFPLGQCSPWPYKEVAPSRVGNVYRVSVRLADHDGEYIPADVRRCLAQRFWPDLDDLQFISLYFVPGTGSEPFEDFDYRPNWVMVLHNTGQAPTLAEQQDALIRWIRWATGVTIPGGVFGNPVGPFQTGGFGDRLPFRRFDPWVEVYRPAFTDWEEVYRPAFPVWQEVYRPNEPITEWQEVYRPNSEIQEWQEVYRPNAELTEWQEVYRPRFDPIEEWQEVYRPDAPVEQWLEVYRPSFDVPPVWEEVYRPNDPILEWQEVYRPAFATDVWQEVYRPNAAVPEWQEVYRPGLRIPDEPLTATIEWRPYFGLEWENVTDRKASAGFVTQGRDLSTLGGGSPQSSPSRFEANFLGPPPEPGDLCRVTLENRVIFLGNLADVREIQNHLHQCSWLGLLWSVTADHSIATPRLYPLKTARQMMTSFGREHDVPVRILGSDETIYTREMPRGGAGLLELEEMTGGAVYDTPDAIVLEHPNYRSEQRVKRFLTDLDPFPGEISIPRATRQRNAFRVYNDVQVTLRQISPKPDVIGDTGTVNIPRGAIEVTTEGTSSESIIETGFYTTPPLIPILDWDLSFRLSGAEVLRLQGREQAATGDITGNRGTGTAQVTVGGRTVTATVSVKGLMVEKAGSVLVLSFDYEASIRAGGLLLSGAFEVDGTLTLTTLWSLEPVVWETTEHVTDRRSAQRYKLRSRERPILITQALIDPVVGPRGISRATQGKMVQVGRRFLNRHHEPIAAEEVVTDNEDLILARRMSDREHLRLQNGAFADYYVEAMKYQLTPLIQTAWLVAGEHAIGEPQTL